MNYEVNSIISGIDGHRPFCFRVWHGTNRVYAETYSLFMIYGNRCGFEDGVGFWGGSEIIDPFGRRQAKARYYDEDFIAVDAGFDAVRRKRTMSPLLRDEDLDLTIKELMRIRERPGAKIVQGFPSTGSTAVIQVSGTEFIECKGSGRRRAPTK